MVIAGWLAGAWRLCPRRTLVGGPPGPAAGGRRPICPIRRIGGRAAYVCHRGVASGRGGNTKSYYTITKCKPDALDPDPVGRRGRPSRRRSRRFTGECPVAATRKMIICPYPFCNARAWLGRLVDPSSDDRCERELGCVWRAACAASAGHVRWLRLADARCERSA